MAGGGRGCVLCVLDQGGGGGGGGGGGVILYLKVLVPHEVEGFLNLGDSTGPFPAEVSGGTSVQVVCALLTMG